MVSNKVISVFRNAVGQLAMVTLSPEEEAHVKRLADDLSLVLKGALARNKAKQNL